MSKKTTQKHSEKIPSKNKSFLFLVVILVIVVLFAFSNIGKNQFVGWDDIVYVTGNKTIKLTPDNVYHSFFKGETHGMYVPLTALSLSINHSFSGFKTAPYLYTNLFLHLITVLLCFIFIRKLTKHDIISFFVSLLFAIHPAQAEIIAYASGRRDVLFALFVLLSLIYYLNYIQEGFNKKQLAYSLGFFVLSLLSKPQALLYPFVLLALDRLYNRNVFSKDVLTEKIGFMILCLLFGVISVLVKQHSVGFDISRETLAIPFYARIVYAFYGFILYIMNVFIPINLSLIHPYPNDGIPIMAWLSFIPVVVLLVWLVIKFRKSFMVSHFGILFFGVMMALMLQLFPNSYGLMNDHYLYLPQLGAFLFITSLFFKNIKNQTISIFILSFYSLFFIFMCRERVSVFKNSISVFNDVIKKYPDSYVAYNNRGSIYFEQNNLELAFNDFSESIRIKPENPYALNNRSVIYLSNGKAKDAINDLDKVILLKPDYADAYSNRGIAKGMILDKSAIDDHNKAIQLNPNEGKYYYNRGAFYLQSGDKIGCSDIKKAKQLGANKTNPIIDQMCQ